MTRVPEKTLPEFWDMLRQHDWFYSYSDDPSMYSKGETAERAIEATVNQSLEHELLYIVFADAVSSHLPYPPRPSEELTPTDVAVAQVLKSLGAAA